MLFLAEVFNSFKDLNLLTKKAFIVDYGYYQDNGKQVIVTSGAGTWGPPIRIGTKSEVVEITVNYE